MSKYELFSIFVPSGKVAMAAFKTRAAAIERIQSELKLGSAELKLVWYDGTKPHLETFTSEKKWKSNLPAGSKVAVAANEHAGRERGVFTLTRDFGDYYEAEGENGEAHVIIPDEIELLLGQ